MPGKTLTMIVKDNRTMISIRPFLTIVFIFLISNICFHPNPADGAEAIDGTVMAGSVDNQITLTFENPSTGISIEDVTLEVAQKGQWITNVRIKSDGSGPVAPGKTRLFTVLFDISKDAKDKTIDKVVMNMSAKGAFVDHPEQVIAVRIEKPAAEEETAAATAEKEVVPVLKLVKITGPKTGNHVEHKTEYQTGDAGVILTNPSNGPADVKWKGVLRITKAPAEIKLGEPFEISAEIKVRRNYNKEAYCYRKEGGVIIRGSGNFRTPDTTRLSPSLSMDIGRGVRAQSQEDLHPYCSSNDANQRNGKVLDRPVKKDGSITLNIFFKPVSQDIEDRVLHTKRIYRYKIEYQTPGRLMSTLQGRSDYVESYKIEIIKKIDAKGNLHPEEKPKKLATFTPSFSWSGYPFSSISLHYDLIHQGTPYVKTLPQFPIPEDLLKPPRDGSEPSGETAGPGSEITGSSADNSSTGSSGRVGSDQPIDPDKLDPKRQDVKALIQQWTNAAEPPQNATQGAKLNYDPWGRVVGKNADGGIISAGPKPAYALPTPEETVWSIRDKLDSVNHCTLEEYVVAKLQNQSLDNCQGRYKKARGDSDRGVKVKDLTGQGLSQAKQRLEKDGFKVRPVGGSPAPSPDKVGKVQSQDPAPGTVLKKGQTIKVKIYGPVKKITMTDLSGKTVKDAKAWLKNKGLKTKLAAAGPAPSKNLSLKVKKTDPAEGKQIAIGTEVKVSVYGKYTAPNISVPNVTGLSVKKAKSKLQQKGFKVRLAAAGPAPSEALSLKVKETDPTSGTKLIADKEVVIKVYGKYSLTLVKIPDVKGMSWKQAKQKISEKGLKAKPVAGGSAPSQGKSEKVAMTQPKAGKKIRAGTVVKVHVYSKYVVGQEDLVARKDCRNGYTWSSSKNKCINKKPTTTHKCPKTLEGSWGSGKPKRVIVREGNQYIATEYHWAYPNGIRQYKFETKPRRVQVPGIDVPVYVGKYWVEDKKRWYKCYVELTAGKMSNRYWQNIKICNDPREWYDMSKDWYKFCHPDWRRYCDSINTETQNTSEGGSQPEKPSKEEQVAALDCSRWPGSAAHWDNGANRPLCGCTGNLVWNKAKTQCVSRAAAEQELCASNFPGSIPGGRNAEGNLVCNCPQGFVWTADRTRCIKKRQQPGGGGGTNNRQGNCNILVGQIKMLSDLADIAANKAVVKSQIEFAAAEARRFGCPEAKIQQAMGKYGTGGGGQPGGRSNPGGNSGGGTSCKCPPGSRMVDERHAFGQGDVYCYFPDGRKQIIYCP